MISVEQLKVEFGTTPLFEDASFVVNAKDRIALVGKNGAGKSTLLKILSGKQTPTSGNVSVQKDISIGYLPQVMPIENTVSVLEETKKAFSHIHNVQATVNRLQEELAVRTDYDSDAYIELVERFSQESELLQMMGGTNYQAEMERTLQGLGFEREEFNRPTSELSGGWRMRIELAKLLLQHPDVLLLDEPTNHLDIESIRWLENFLSRSSSAVILVSHDRTFLNNVTNRTLEISCGQIVDYKVKYDDYLTLRAERREQQLRAYENQQKEIADIKNFIERFRYQATKAVQVQSRIKQLEKIVPIEVDEVDNSFLHLKFPPCKRSGDYPVIADHVGKDYDGKIVFKDANLTIKRGEKIAFVGKNGEGKSTMVKCIMNEIPYSGHLKIGHNVDIGYFAQNQAQLLDENLTVFETIDNIAKGEVRLKIRDILGAFMFGGEAQEKKVKVLSGGERSRLAMIKLLLEPVNLLILDEPTNHLDLRTKEVLKEAILAFDGTVIVVSHDRDFLNGLVDRIYEFGNGKLTEFIGGIYDYLQKKELETEHITQLNNSSEKPSQNEQSPTLSSLDDGRLSYEAQKEKAKEQRKLQKAVSEAEEAVTKIEQEIAEIEAQLSTPEYAQDLTLIERYGVLQKSLATATEQWEQAVEALEN